MRAQTEMRLVPLEVLNKPVPRGVALPVLRHGEARKARTGPWTMEVQPVVTATPRCTDDVLGLDYLEVQAKHLQLCCCSQPRSRRTDYERADAYSHRPK